MAANEKDRRYYELIEDTINPEFKYGYFGLRDERGSMSAFQPFSSSIRTSFSRTASQVSGGGIWRGWPRFMVLRTPMIGCVAGEGHVDDGDELTRRRTMECLAGELTEHARRLKADLIVLKEFPAQFVKPCAASSPMAF